jgi:hypothetical protein
MAQLPSSRSSPEELKKCISRIPRDDDGFTIAFDPNDEDEWSGFMSQFGFVVVKVLTPAECDATVTEFFAEANARPRPDGRVRDVPLSVDDPRGWESENWPAGRSRFLVDFPAVSPCALRNRTHPNVYAFFSRLLKTPRVFASIDAWGLMRGTSGLPTEQSERPEWRQNLVPHWDVNPWQYAAERSATRQPLPPMYQGVLALVDCDDATGGFSIAPGSARYLDVWARGTAASTAQGARSNHFDTDPSDVWRGLVQHVPIRAGEMVVWDSGSLHANYPNHGPNLRLVQYTRCCTDEFEGDPIRGAHLPWVTARKYAGLNLNAAATTAQLSLLQRQMLGLQPYLTGL